MKKYVFLIIAIIMIFITACGKSAGPEVAADYDSVQDAIAAQRSGTDITGKTIRVEMNQDSAAGIIYDKPDTGINANICVTIITDDSNRDEVLALKKGDTVVVRVDTYDDHLKYNIYVYAKEYTIN